ncbi:SRPBCC family protein [Actinosynnema sp. NPDC059335]|uniref:SRPBCC family protein n=1 Tax=Actinosynnema sp. NPDC059335 TaxID=3346804 RepID=UPI00366FBF88
MTTTTHPETGISADPALPVIHITREFDASRESVFRAHVDPELVVKWLGPRSVTMRVDRWDATTGGAYRYVHSRGDEEYRFYGSFHEVRPAERIVQTFTFEGYPDGVALETLTLEELDGGRTRLHVVSVFESTEARDMALASGMETGVVEGYEQLDELLAGA